MQGRFGAAYWPLWHLASVVLVLLGPSQLWLRIPYWRLPVDQLPQGLVMAAAYLALALFLRQQDVRPRPVLPAIAASLICFGVASLLLLARPDVISSRFVIALSAALGIGLAFLPFMLGGYRRYGLLVLAAASSACVATGLIWPKAETAKSGPQDRVISTALNAVSVTYLRNLLEPVKSDGGGLARYRDGFLLATGSGEIYRLEWEPGGNVLRPTRLALTAPMDRNAFLADLPAVPDQQGPPGGPPRRLLPTERFRVTDVALDNPLAPTSVYLAHQHWNRAGKCMTMRVSVAPLPDLPSSPPGPAPGWRTVFESQPCLTLSATYEGSESGGRLAWTREGRLLLTLGSFGFDGLNGPPAVAQAENNDYGKILLLDLAGGREVFTMGHRNAQGLLVDRKGRIWETEHGPQGGDELNLLRRGGNYGWPFVTYGTDYGRTYWPIAKPDDGRTFEEPVYAFVPSIAVSNLIELGPAMFPEWEGDLLVASLSAQSLYRMRLHGDRVAYFEPIRIGRRIRDLEQGADGRIVAWTDEGDIVVLGRSMLEPQGQRVYRQCSRCHEPVAGGTAPGPSLRGRAGKPVASEPGYAYTPALARLGGSWTDERLDMFLRNPAEVAPGTSMQFVGIPDAAERRVLIEYLKSYR